VSVPVFIPAVAIPWRLPLVPGAPRDRANVILIFARLVVDFPPVTKDTRVRRASA